MNLSAKKKLLIIFDRYEDMETMLFTFDTNSDREVHLRDYLNKESRVNISISFNIDALRFDNFHMVLYIQEIGDERFRLNFIKTLFGHIDSFEYNYLGAVYADILAILESSNV